MPECPNTNYSECKCNCQVNETVCKTRNDKDKCVKNIKRVHNDYYVTTHVQPIKYITHQKHRITKLYEPICKEKWLDNAEPQSIEVCDDFWKNVHCNKPNYCYELKQNAQLCRQSRNYCNCYCNCNKNNNCKQSYNYDYDSDCDYEYDSDCDSECDSECDYKSYTLPGNHHSSRLKWWVLQ